jgi:DAK2 domain fusion protein YloV
VLQSLDGAAVRRWAATCCDVLAAHRDEIDALNVFPVPDQDTGSNLLATMRAGLDAVLRRGRHEDPDVAPGGTAAVLARGALLGARGNSGVILSQVLRGLAEPLIGGDAGSGVPSWNGAALREGLRRADELALAAVADPAPGTVLTVLHAAAEAAAAVRSDELGEVASAATAAAVGALADTPRQLAALAAAGVVDAGGRGLILLLEALLAVVTERPGIQSAAATRIHPRPVSARHGGSTNYEYEVMYLLGEADEASVGVLRAELATLGDCVAIVGTSETWHGQTSGLWNVHVHCSDAGAAIEAGMRAGRPHRVNVTRFADQIHGEHPRDAAHDHFTTRHAVLVMVTGSGVAALCRGEGGHGVITAPPTSSVGDLLAILVATGGRHVTVLAEPGAACTAQIAAVQARVTGLEVAVLPVGSPVQALAAVAVHDSARRPAEDLVAMTDAAAGIRCGELTVARAEAWTTAGYCQAGAVLGILGDQIVLINRDPLAAACELMARMLSVGGELGTVLLGDDAPEGLGDALIGKLRAAHPDVEMVVYGGDVPGRVLVVGVE